jgi:hypothetical protein
VGTVNEHHDILFYELKPFCISEIFFFKLADGQRNGLSFSECRPGPGFMELLEKSAGFLDFACLRCKMPYFCPPKTEWIGSSVG